MDEESNTAEEQQAEPRNKFPVAAYIMMAQGLTRGMADFFVQVVLDKYMCDKLLFTSEEADALIDARGMMSTFLLPFGAMFVTSLFNRYVALIIGTILFAAAQFILFIASMPALRKRFVLYIYWVIDGIGMFTAAGAFSTFGGDQFKLPEQQNQMMKYYGMMVFIHNFGGFLTHFIGPALMKQVHCFGEQDCYSISLGISAILYSVELVVYLVSAKYFVRNEPTYDIIINFCGCIGYGLKQWVYERKTNPLPNWLDHAEPQYGAQLVKDIKRYFQILIVLATFPVLSAVYYRIETKYLLQATRMDGRISGTSYTIMPDHYELLHPFLILVLVPLIIEVFDPITYRWGFNRTLRRFILGWCLTVFSILMAGVVETYVKQTYPKKVSQDESELRIFNGLNCSYTIQASDIGIIEMYPLGVYTKKHFPVRDKKSIKLSSVDGCAIFSEDINLEGGQAISVSVQKNNDGAVGIMTYEEIVEKSETGFPVVSVLGLDVTDCLMIVDSKKVYIEIQADANDKPRSTEVVPGTYTMMLNGRKIMGGFATDLGGVYVASIVGNDLVSLHEVVEPNSVHMLWLCPQEIVLTLGEIYWETAMMAFLYGEAPISLKQVVVATYLFLDRMGIGGKFILTIFGDLEQDHEFYLSAFIAALDIVILFLIALRFKPLDPKTKVI